MSAEERRLWLRINSFSALIMAYTPKTTEEGCRKLLTRLQQHMHEHVEDEAPTIYKGTACPK